MNDERIGVAPRASLPPFIFHISFFMVHASFFMGCT